MTLPLGTDKGKSKKNDKTDRIFTSASPGGYDCNYDVLFSIIAERGINALTLCGAFIVGISVVNLFL